jgi:hypothetical protein
LEWTVRRALLGTLVAALVLLTGALGAAASDHYRARDFYALWSGARLVAAGIDPYDEKRWCIETEGVSADATTRSGQPACPVRYAYPLFTAVLLLPLGLLPLVWASSLWLSISLAAALAATAFAWRAAAGSARGAPLLIAVVVGSEPFWLMVAGGQLSGVLALGVALSAFEAKRRESFAGAALGLVALKPNVLAIAAALVALRALVAREWAFLVGGAAAVVALLAISLPLRPAWPSEWLGELFGRQIGHAAEYATAWGIAAHDLGSLAWGFPLVAALVATCLLVARGVPRDRVAFLALAVPLSLFATPYAWSYDFVVLALPWAFVLSRCERLAPAPRRALRYVLVAVASPLTWILYLIAFARETETLSALIPALTALLVSVAARAPEASVDAAIAARPSGRAARGV